MTRKHGARETAPDPSANFFRATLSAIALAALALEMAAAGPLRAQLWGFHLKAFAPPLIVLASLAATLGAVGLLLLPRPRAERMAEAMLRPFARIQLGLPAIIALLALVATALFWLCRSRQDLLGDAWPLVNGLPAGERFHPRQPLTAFLQHQIFKVIGPFFAADGRSGVGVARHTVALGSVVCGAVFVVAALVLGWLLAAASSARERASEVVRADRSTAVLLGLVILSQGYALLYFGYLENYTFNALFTALYLLAGLLYLARRLPLVIVLFIFLWNFGLHLSSIALLPSVIFLVAYGVLIPSRRAGAIRDLPLAIGGLFLLNWVLSRIEPDYSLREGLRGLLGTARTDVGGGAGWSYLFSISHWRDFINEHYLIGPLAAFLFLPGLVHFAAGAIRRRGVTLERTDVRAVFLSVAALAYLAGSWAMAEPALGYARDWDLFAPAGVTYTAAGLLFLMAVREHRERHILLLAAFLLSASHLACWVSVNHSEARALARFENLPLGRGRGETVLARWHFARGNEEAGKEWLERALRAAPDNVNALAMLGEMRLREGRPDLAAQCFEQALRARPDKLEYRESLVSALVSARRFDAAMPHFTALLARDPPRYQSWLDYGKALAALGRQGEARQAFERAVTLIGPLMQTNRNDATLNFDRGVALAWLGRMEEAIASFDRALAARSNFDAALFNAALILEQLGRTSEARGYLERFVRAHPQHPQRERALRWLQGAARPDTTKR